MPLIYRIFGYGGNVLLLLFGLAGVFSEGAWLGVFMVAMAGLNIYLIRKIDLYSREEAWLEAELHKRELRRQIAEFDRQSAGGTAAEPKRIPPSKESEPPSG